MPDRPVRVTVVLTHPVQYFAPWFRFIHASEPRLQLSVLYASRLTATAQATGFGGAFSWDVPLLDGYTSRVLNHAPAIDDVGADRFSRVDAPGLDEALMATEPDAVIVPGWHAAMYRRARRICRRHQVPMIYRGDSNLLSGPPGALRWAWMLRTRRRIAEYDAYLSVGTRSRDYLIRFRAPEPLVFESPHAVDNAFFAQPSGSTRESRDDARARLGLAPGAFVVLFAGKLQAKKRPLDAVAAVARMGGDAQLLVAGSGPLEEACRAEAQRLGASVAWAGFLNQSEMAAAYRAADCLVLPSDGRETWGLVVNEALASGLPVVTSDAVGCQLDLVVEGETGAVAPVGDVEGLSRALARVRDARRAGHDFAPACLDRVARYSFAAATAGVVAVCDRLRRRAVARVRARQGRPRVLAACIHMVTPGGLERMSFEVLRVLIDHGAGVHCQVNAWSSERIVALAEQTGADWSTGFYWRSLSRHARSPLEIGRMAMDAAGSNLSLLLAAWRLRATAVFVPDFLVPVRNAPALAVLRMLRRRIVLRVGTAPGPGPFYQWLWRWVIDPAVDRIVCNSEFIRREVLALGVAPGKVGLIRNCLATRPPAGPAARDPWKIIYVGQIIPPKGVELLFDAVAELRGQGLPATLDIVGDMDRWEPQAFLGFQARLRSRAEQDDLRGAVRFLGAREDVPALMQGAAVHCCPSTADIREGMAGVVLEAKAGGIPSVVTTSGSLPELVEHQRDGWIAAPEAHAIAEGLRYFFANAAVRAQAGEEAARSLSRFDPASFERAWLAEFDLP